MKKGFTLVELLIVMGIMAILSSFAVINLIRPQTKASLDTTVTTLTSDLKSQQLKAMIGDGEGGVADTFGLYIEPSKYTLFKGTYNLANPDNFVVNVEGGVTLSTSFPSSQIIFQRVSGEIVGYSGTSNTITISSAGESKTITVNPLGTLSTN